MNNISQHLNNSFHAIHSLLNSTLSIKQNRRTRLLRYLQHSHGIRIDLVQKIYDERLPLPENITPKETAATLLLMSADMPFDAVIQKIYQQDEWAQVINSNLFTALENTSLELQQSGYDKEARDMLRIGELAAHMKNFQDWEQLFRGKINRQLQARIADMPFLKQRGW